MRAIKVSKQELGRLAVYTAFILTVLVVLSMLGMQSVVAKVIICGVAWQLAFPRLLGTLHLGPGVEGVIAKVAVIVMLNPRDWLMCNMFDVSTKTSGAYAGRYMSRLFACGPLHVLSFRAPLVALEVFHRADAELDAERQIAPIEGTKLRIVALVARRGTDIHMPATATILAAGPRLQARRTRGVRVLSWMVQAEGYRGQV